MKTTLIKMDSKEVADCQDKCFFPKGVRVFLAPNSGDVFVERKRKR